MDARREHGDRQTSHQAAAGAGRADDAHAARSDTAAEPEPVEASQLDPELRVPRDAYDRFRRLILEATSRIGGHLGHETTEVLLLVPDLLLLFVALARDPRVDRRFKLLAGAVAAYLLSPVDLMPEALLGPLGMADDMVLAFLALETMLNHVPREILLDHWRGRRDLLEVARLGTALGSRLIPRALHDRVLRWLRRAGG
ncbi:MAG: YkvA family protein [Candidatus Eiseniibacteriota bacterium]|jgi:uncharacterized membrane protein YkvA (DUF1232 family)